MQGRIGLLLAGAALAVGGGVAGAVVVAPQLAGEDNASLTAEQAADRDELVTKQKAFKTAKKARSMARGARQLGDSLVPQVEQALNQSGQALNSATSANNRLDAQQVVSNTAAGQVTTDSDTAWVPLEGGPQVTVTVPQSGLIEVFSSATIGEDGNGSVAADGAVALFEDGQQIRIATDPTFGFCDPNPPGLEGPLFFIAGGPGDEFPVATPPTLAPLGCGMVGNGSGGLLLQRSPGTHTYELRYGDCDCDPEPAAFSDRVLRIAPLP